MQTKQITLGEGPLVGWPWPAKACAMGQCALVCMLRMHAKPNTIEERGSTWLAVPCKGVCQGATTSLGAHAGHAGLLHGHLPRWQVGQVTLQEG